MSDLNIGDSITIEDRTTLLVIALSYGDDRQAYTERRTTVVLQPAMRGGKWGSAGWRNLLVDIPRGGGSSSVSVWAGSHGWVHVWALPQHETEAISLDSETPDRAIATALLSVALDVLR